MATLAVSARPTFRAGHSIARISFTLSRHTALGWPTADAFAGVIGLGFARSIHTIFVGLAFNTSAGTYTLTIATELTTLAFDVVARIRFTNTFHTSLTAWAPFSITVVLNTLALLTNLIVWTGNKVAGVDAFSTDASLVSGAFYVFAWIFV